MQLTQVVQKHGFSSREAYGKVGPTRCCLLQVAIQVASVVRYLATIGFIMWDVHHEDVLIDHLGKVTFLDIFMGPCECLASTPEVLVPDQWTWT